MVLAKHLSSQPVIDHHHGQQVGDNINGPSVIEVPAWLPRPLGRYYLYFAHHTGDHIRMAYADQIDGQWTILDGGVLDLSETGFVKHSVPSIEDGKPVVPHIASPDVHIDKAGKQIRMLFHGVNLDGTQTTRLAISDDGLKFREVSDTLAPPYLRVTWWQDQLIGVAWGGEMFTSPRWDVPFERGPKLLERPNGPDMIPRHPFIVLRGSVMHVFYSLIGEQPERIWHVNVHLSENWQDWSLGTPKAILSPMFEWEGANLPVTASSVGPANGLEHALRDPFVIDDYLFYVGGGESGIGIAEIDWGDD